MEFDPIERYYDMSSEEIARIQEKKLREFMRFQLYPFSPYYHDLFQKHGIDPESIRTVKDLEKIPLTRKEDIMPTEENPKRYKDFILQPELVKLASENMAAALEGISDPDLTTAKKVVSKIIENTTG